MATLSAVPALLPGRDPGRMRKWPLHSYLELRALPASVRTARAHARGVLHEWCLPALVDTVELLVSEIATNAVRASARIARQRGAGQHDGGQHDGGQRDGGQRDGGQRDGGQLPMRLCLASDRCGVLIQVWDADRHQPIPQHLGPDAECGRGLLLVETLSAQWGHYEPDGPDCPGGKVVWALATGQ